MRRFHTTITPGVIHHQARQVLESCLDWKPFHESVTVKDLLSLLLMMAGSAASLCATVRRFFSFSHQTGTLAIQSNLPSMERLNLGLVQALYDVMQFSRQDRRRRWLLAIDTHNVPYYGKHAPQIATYLVGGPKKQGTKWFLSYATAVLLHAGRRYTVGLCPLPAKTKPHEIVARLLDQIAAKGLKIRGVALDSAFDSGETILLLQERALAYVVPLRRKGSGRNARNKWFEGSHQRVKKVEWKTKSTHRLVKTHTFLWKGRRKTMLFAYKGWLGQRAHSIYEVARRQYQLYRRRFGIETSYRQKNQAKAFTTSRDPVYRLLLEGLGYLLRQLWVILTERLAKAAKDSATGGSGPILTLQQMVDWLVRELESLYPETRSMPCPTVNYEQNNS